MFAHIGPEALLVSLALLLALVRPQLGATWFARAERALAAVARRRTLSVLLCGFSALAVRLALLPWLPIPHPVHQRRVQLPAGRRHLCPRTPRQSHAPHVGAFGNLPRHFSPDLCVDVSAAAGIGPCLRPGRFRAPVLGSVAQRRRDVRRHLLDAASLVSALVGAARRHAAGAALWRVQLLGQQLLGRRSGSDWRSAGAGRHAAHHAATARARCDCDGDRNGDAGQHPALRRTGAEPGRRRHSDLLDREEEASRGRMAAARRAPDVAGARGSRRRNQLLLLESHRQSPASAAAGEPGDLFGGAIFLRASCVSRAHVSPQGDPRLLCRLGNPENSSTPIRQQAFSFNSRRRWG